MESDYVVYLLLGLLVAFAIAVVLATIIKLIGRKKINIPLIVIIGVVSFMASLGIAFCIYVGSYNHADVSANKYLESTSEVKVNKIDSGYFFDGKGNKDAIIFYPGAKVEATAYAPLLFELAEDGIDTFLIEMPCNLAFFGKNKANDILKKYNYENYYLMGHSLGGAMGASFVASNSDKFKGMILLASYSTEKIPDNIKVLSIYGANDGVLKMDNYKKNKSNLPSSMVEYVIDGGNHSGFANYVTQSDDHLSSITVLEQQTITKNKILDFLFSDSIKK